MLKLWHHNRDFAHCIFYGKILEENNMENGLIEESIQFVREKYRNYLKNGNAEFSQTPCRKTERDNENR